VDLDHTDRLGSTVEAIAREKAAIIERGDLAVSGATGAAGAIVRRRARRLEVPLVEVEPAPIVDWDRDRLRVTLPRLGTVDVGLRGRHQAANVAVADALLDALDLAGIARVGDDARRRGYAAAAWPGRLELLTVDGHEVLLDGAHNPAGAAALAVALADLRPYLAPGPISLVTASMADKDVDGVIDALAAGEPLRGATVIATTVDAPRALRAEDLAARWRGRSAGLGLDGVIAERDPLAAVRQAIAQPGPTVVAGSLYLVGAVRADLVDDPLLRDPEPGP
jgi:dihydrofolate synthase/folylpolyglutamate synthase